MWDEDLGERKGVSSGNEVRRDAGDSGTTGVLPQLLKDRFTKNLWLE